jgi:O-antigen/teichoic acid export membrane protein
VLLRNTIYNLAGFALPLLVAVFAIPLLLSELGAARFGFLTLIWAVTGYFGLFDLGIGRAITRIVAIRAKANQYEIIGGIIGSGHAVMLGVGIVAGLLLYAVADPLVRFTAGLPDKRDAITAVMFMAAAVPAIVLTAGVRGLLEGLGAFKAINIIRVPTGIITFVGPLLSVFLFGPSLAQATAILAIGRVLGLFAHITVAYAIVPKNARVLSLSRADTIALLTTGGWLTVSNLIGPLLGYLDRFVVGTSVSAMAVAYYATPQEITARLWIIPSALTAVLFPAFAADMQGDKDKVAVIFTRATLALFVLIMPASAALILFAHEVLRVWINADFADKSALILQLFSVGIWLNCLTQIPFTLIQGAGKSKWAAVAQLVELPLFIGLLWWWSVQWGVRGATAAWLIRMVVDAALMFSLGLRLLPGENQIRNLVTAGACFAIVSATLVIIGMTDLLVIKGLVTFAIVLLSLAFAVFAMRNWKTRDDFR